MVQSHIIFALDVTTTPSMKGTTEVVEAIKIEALTALPANNPRPADNPIPTDSPAVSRTASRLVILPSLYFFALTRANMPPYSTPTAALALRGLRFSIIDPDLIALALRPKLYPSVLVLVSGQK